MTGKIAATLAAMVVVAGIANASALADPGNGQAKGHEKRDAETHGNAPEHAGHDAETPPPGHAKAEGEPAQPQHAAAPKRRPERPAKPARSPRPAPPAPRPARPAKPAAPQVNPHAKAGKTTICHATGSATNPYVAITISDNALPAHARHQDGRDLIPAPAGGCPQPAAAAGRPAKREAGGIDAAPAEAESAPDIAAPAAAAEDAPAGAVLAFVAESGAAVRTFPRLADTPETAGDGRRETGVRTVTAAASQAAPAIAEGQLPFTGLPALLIGLVGLLMALTGMLVRNLTGGRPAY